MECCSGLRADTTPIAEARPCSGTCRRVPNCSTPDISAAAGNLGGEGKESKNYSACAVSVARLAGPLCSFDKRTCGLCILYSGKRCQLRHLQISIYFFSDILTKQSSTYTCSTIQAILCTCSSLQKQQKTWIW
jgi:hypothetical protein